MKATVDGLVKALTDIVTTASSVSYFKVHPDKHAPRSYKKAVRIESLDVIHEAFQAILGSGRDLMGIKFEGCPSRIYKVKPPKGSIHVVWRDETTVYTITIDQQSVHALGGTPYGAH